MINKLLVFINLLLLSVGSYGYFLFQSYTDDVEYLKTNIITNNQIAGVLERLNQADQSLLKKLPLTQIKSGTIQFNAKGYPAVINPDGCEADRGLYQHKVVFQKPFINEPKVTFGLTSIDFREGADHRLKIEISEVSKLGFTVNLVTWCDTKISLAEANWIAFYSL